MSKDHQGEVVEEVTYHHVIISKQTSTPSLNITAYPHIITGVIRYSSNPTLLILAQCSKSMFHFVIPVLYRTFHIESQQLKPILYSMNETTPFHPKYPFSPFLHAAQRHVRSLHVHSYEGRSVDDSKDLGQILQRVNNVVLYPTLVGHYWDIMSPYIGPVHLLLETLAKANLDHVFIHVPDERSLHYKSGPYNILLDYSNPYITNLTVLVPSTTLHTCITLISGFAGNLTIVYLPPDHPSSNQLSPTQRRERASASNWLGCLRDLFTVRTAEPEGVKSLVTVVGAEDSGLSQRHIRQALSLKESDGWDKTPDRGDIVLLSFNEWLANQEPDTAFTQKEIDGNRADVDQR